MRRSARLRCRFFLLLLIVCMIPAIQVKADWKDEGKDIQRKDFYLGESEEELDAKAVSEDGVLHLTVDTTGKKKGYYAVSFFKNLTSDKNEYAGIALEVKNNQSEPVRMNVSCINNDGDALAVRDGADVIFKTEKKYTSEKVENGSFEVPAAYEGEVYLPFNELALSGSMESAEPEGVQGIGFTLVIPEETLADIEISSIFLTMCTEEMKKQTAYLILEGDETVLKPTLGESVSQYHAVAYNIAGEPLDEAVVRYEISGSEGAKIDENSGLLCINQKMEQEIIPIRAIAEDGSVTEKKVEVKVSWTTMQKTDNGYDASLASPDEVADIQEKIRFLTEEKLIWMVRIAAVVALVIFMIHYQYHRRKRTK